MPITRNQMKQSLERYFSYITSYRTSGTENYRRFMPAPSELADVDSRDKPYLLKLILDHLESENSEILSDHTCREKSFLLELVRKLFTREDFADKRLANLLIEQMGKLAGHLAFGSRRELLEFLREVHCPDISVLLISHIKRAEGEECKSFLMSALENASGVDERQDEFILGNMEHLLGDRRETVLVSTIEALAHAVRTPKQAEYAMSRLLPIIGSGVTSCEYCMGRLAAIRALGRVARSPEQIELARNLLEQLIHNQNIYVRTAAAISLSQVVRTPEEAGTAINLIAPMMGDENFALCPDVAVALAQAARTPEQAERVIGILAPLIYHNHPPVKMAAVRALRKVVRTQEQSETVMEILTPSLGDVGEAACSLAQVVRTPRQVEDATNLIMPLLRDEYADRNDVIEALAKLSPSRCAMELMQIIESSDSRSMEAELRGLALTGEPRAMAFLLQKCEDPRHSIDARYTVRQILNGNFFEKHRDDATLTGNISKSLRSLLSKREADAIHCHRQGNPSGALPPVTLSRL